MSEWTYRATANQADWGSTDDCLTEHHFLCRTAFAERNSRTGAQQLVANVRHVAPGDLIHVAFSSEVGLEGLGSFEVLGSTHPDQEGPIDHAEYGRLSLFRVREESPLGKMLAGTTYIPDPLLRWFTGWHVQEAERRDIQFTPNMFPGNNALHRFPLELSSETEPFALSHPEPSSQPTPAFPRAESTITFPSSGRFLGVDWSGAAHAGRKVWAAAVKFDETSGPSLEFVKRPFYGQSASTVAAGFATWLQSEDFVAAGLDFCFGVSRNHKVVGIPTTGPADLGLWVAANYPSPVDFKLALGAEEKRATDRLCSSPFAPTNLRMFRQTYWGIRALAGSTLAILPWGNPSAEKVVVEILPAQMASVLCPNCRYKGNTSQARLERQRLLTAITSSSGLSVSTNDAATILDDREGDAMDAVLASLVAASAKARNFGGTSSDAASSGEGWIFPI